jgi:hypothetical protein
MEEILKNKIYTLIDLLSEKDTVFVLQYLELLISKSKTDKKNWVNEIETISIPNLKKDDFFDREYIYNDLIYY